MRTIMEDYHAGKSSVTYPESIKNNVHAQAFYGVLSAVFDEAKEAEVSPDFVAEIAEEITKIVANHEAVEKLGKGHALKNGEQYFCEKIRIEAIAAYNLTPERQKFHPQGVGNGYVLNIGSERVYISGDTEDIPEMRKLKDIDHAFVSMNLPYTMSVEQAASAITDFRPRNLYPYHYRNQDGSFSDVQGKLKSLLSEYPKIKIHYPVWYKK
jgi:L-ascorbate metabolism protein UlaG (beta-lactamase superfamily)